MNTGLSLVSELIENRDRLKEARSIGASKLQRATKITIYKQAHYKGLEYGIDYGNHLDCSRFRQEEEYLNECSGCYDQFTRLIVN